MMVRFRELSSVPQEEAGWAPTSSCSTPEEKGEPPTPSGSARKTEADTKNLEGRLANQPDQESILKNARK